jgi:hypothetical protein
MEMSSSHPRYFVSRARSRRRGLVTVAMTLFSIQACSGDSDKTATSSAPMQTAGDSMAAAASGGGSAAGTAAAAGGAGPSGAAKAVGGAAAASAGASGAATSAAHGGRDARPRGGAGASGSATSAADGGSHASARGGAGAEGSASSAGGACTREALRAAVDAYYDALTAHGTGQLALAANVKYTENAKTLMPGEGVWKTAGMVKFKRTAVDTMTCQTATESVIPDGSTDRVYGVRLKLDADGKISEIEAILVTDYILIMPAGLVGSKDDDWETVLPADQQLPRDQMQAVMDKYLKEFPSGACGFASSCKRLEDGGSVGACVDGSLVTCNMMERPEMNVLKPLNHVIDVQAGIVVGFTVFLGGYDDFHLFKMRDAEVQSVHAVLTQTDGKTGWE